MSKLLIASIFGSWMVRSRRYWIDVEADTARMTPRPDGTVDFAPLYGIEDVGRVDVRGRWGRRSDRERLNVVIGVRASGAPLVLDMKPAIDGGAGPHGLVFGATASGKSELLQSMVLGLAVEHAPGELNFILAQSMGSDTFDSVRTLPHVAGYFPNFDCDDDNPALGQQLTDVIVKEVLRRLERVDSAGDFDSFSEYVQAVKREGASLDPLPALVIVIDEFSQIARTDERKFLDMVALVGRTGRVAGVNLLLATRGTNPDALHRISPFLSYRIALKTFSRNESREVLGVSDAADLPGIPGEAYLRTGDETTTRFRGAHSSYRIRMPNADEDFGVSFAEALSSVLELNSSVHRLH